MGKGLYIATEDELSELVAKRLISQFCPDFRIFACLRKGGFGYLKSNLRSFCELSRVSHMLLIVDLDNKECAVTLINEWFSVNEKPEAMLFRVAVREIESWILADHTGIRDLLGTKVGKLPPKPDELADPKKSLLKIAEKAPRSIKSDLIPSKDSTASQGLGYNAVLGDFVANNWNPERARVLSDSLDRTIKRIQGLNHR